MTSQLSCHSGLCDVMQGFQIRFSLDKIGTRWEKSGNCLRTFSVKFVSPSQNVLINVLMSILFDVSLTCLFYSMLFPVHHHNRLDYSLVLKLYVIQTINVDILLIVPFIRMFMLYTCLRKLYKRIFRPLTLCFLSNHSQFLCLWFLFLQIYQKPISKC